MSKCKYLLPCGRCDKFDKKCKVKKDCMTNSKYPNGLEPIINPMELIKCKPLPTRIRNG